MKKLRILAALVMSLLFTTAFAATEYYGRVAYGLKGNVKKMKRKSDSKFLKYMIPMKTKVGFTNDGRIKKSFMYYDADGYPLGLSSVAGDMYVMIDIRYDEMKRPAELISKTKHCLHGHGPTLISYKNQYSSSGEVEKCVISTLPDDGDGVATPFAELDYDGYKYDAAGNWIERSVVINVYENGELLEDGRYAETREIEYYQ